MARRSASEVKSIVGDCVGQKFGKLTVLLFEEYRATPRGAKVPYVACVCDCGNTKKVSLWDLRQGKTKTCGLNHPHFEDRSLPAFNMIYRHSYKNRALKKGIVFDITEDQFRELSQQNCHYCGREPQSTSNRGTYKSGKYRSKFVYNGMDRIDSAAGYTLDNVVPCCAICNHAKHTMSYDIFVSWLNDVSQFRCK